MRPMNSSEFSTDQRLRELARIFAMGVLRLRRRSRLAPRPEIAGNTCTGRLELSPDTVLSVTNPVNGPESPKPGAPA